MVFKLLYASIMSKSPFQRYLTVALLAAPLLVAAADRPEVGPYVQAYSGEENASVYVVRLGAPEKAEALVLVSGVDSRVDGVIQKATVVNDGHNRRSYRVKSGNEEREILRLERGSGSLFVATYPHGLNDYRVGYNPDLSRSANAEHLLTRWLEQKPGQK